MKKIFQLCAVLAVMFAVTGCYNDFDAPKPAKVYTDEDFAGMKHISWLSCGTGTASPASFTWAMLAALSCRARGNTARRRRSSGTRERK